MHVISWQHRSSFAVVSLLSFLVACGDGHSLESSSAALGVAPAAATPSSFELIQAGFFRDRTSGLQSVPRLVHVGFTDERDGEWKGTADIPIQYSNGVNEAVIVDVPVALRQKKLLMYSMKVERFGPQASGGRFGWISDQVVSLASPNGHYVTVPASGGAAYPFSPECFQVNAPGEDFSGRIRGVIFGFTRKTRAEYEANNDVPWLDAEGNARHEGFARTSLEHDGGYKGSYVASPIWVRVPDGNNLVFKISFDRFSGSCLGSGDTSSIAPPPGQDSHLTKTYFASP